MENLIDLKDLDFKDLKIVERVFEEYEVIKQYDTDFMELVYIKVGFLNKVHWHQPWYQQMVSLKYQDKLKLKNAECDEKFDEGKILQHEREIMEKNWKKFVKKYKIPDEPWCLSRWKNYTLKNAHLEKARRYAIAFIARGLKRNLYQVYGFFKSRYNVLNRSPKQSALEAKIIKSFIYHKPKFASSCLAAVLGRNQLYIDHKLLDKNKQPAVKWTLQLAGKLLTLLLRFSKKPLESLEGADFKPAVWENIEEAMDMNRKKLKLFWKQKLHVQLFYKANVTIRKIRKKIIKRLRCHTDRFKIWRDIRWAELAEEFPSSFTSTFLLRILHDMFRNYKNMNKKPLTELLDYASNKNKTIKNRVLKTVDYVDGELKYVQYSKTKKN